MGRMANCVAIVTGGGGGIGAAIVEAFGHEGATVVAADTATERLDSHVADLTRRGQRVRGVTADVTDGDAVSRLVQSTLDEHGRIDVLVNNVGDFLGGRGDFVDSTEADWDAQYSVNLRSAFLCSRSVLGWMIAAGHGSIINLSSVEGFRGIPGLVAYGTFKGALDAFTKSLAVEVAPSGVRVNAIAPDKVQSLQTAYQERWTTEQLGAVGQWIPLGRLGQPTDVAGAAVYLASEMSAFTTGTTLHVDGGTWAAGGWYRTPSGRWTNTPPMRAGA